MAHRKQIAHTDGRDYHIYNVTHAVGINCTNKTDDVMLVQFLVKSYFKDPKYAASKPPADLPVTGFFGPTTLAYLRAFFKRASQGGAQMLEDGRIDPAGAASQSTISHTTYKIFVLCAARADYLNGIGQKQRYYHLDQEADRNVPPLLKAAIGPFLAVSGD